MRGFLAFFGSSAISGERGSDLDQRKGVAKKRRKEKVSGRFFWDRGIFLTPFLPFSLPGSLLIPNTVQNQTGFLVLVEEDTEGKEEENTLTWSPLLGNQLEVVSPAFAPFGFPPVKINNISITGLAKINEKELF